jgi:thiol-disulfide isomerase/thioredoxin
VEVGVIDRPGARAGPGSLAPNFLLPDYEQQAVRLGQFAGKVVFINFWASWCTFCEEEMPDIVRLAKRFPDDVVVLAINRGESRGTAEKWTGAHDFEELPNMHWLLDSREDVVDEYRVNGMPQSFVVDADGIVRQEIRRVTEYDEMLDAVENARGTTAADASTRP